VGDDAAEPAARAGYGDGEKLVEPEGPATGSDGGPSNIDDREDAEDDVRAGGRPNQRLRA
jgi:hypothetical protein